MKKRNNKRLGCVNLNFPFIVRPSSDKIMDDDTMTET
jgi:hypothetical protein